MAQQLAVAAATPAQMGFLPSGDVCGLVDRTLLDRVARHRRLRRRTR
jgi:hypothetical protein